MSTFVIGSLDCPKSLLPSNVPKLRFDFHAVDSVDLELKVTSNVSHIVLMEGVMYDAIKQTGFTRIGLPNENDL
jgi:reverse gyrase